jgi:uncharacterized protein
MDSTAPSKLLSASPVAQTERIIILDSLRGFAILGILLMNMPAFSFPGVTDVAASLSEKGLNYYAWYIISLVPDGTQRALFSMLFGAGIILFIKSQEKKVEGLKPADYFFRRQLWLMVFSLFDVFILLWHGDILLDYACLGMIMFAFRNLSPKKLIIAAGVCMLLMMARENRDLYLDKSVISKGEAIAAMDTTVATLTPLQKDDVQAMTDFKDRSSFEKRLQREEKRIRKMRGSFGYVYEARTSRYIENLVPYLFFSLWDVLEFMFLGMAFFKLGILTGQAKTKVYWWMCIIGMSGGLLLSYLRLQNIILHNFNPFDYAKNVAVDFYNVDRTFRALGIFGFIMLLYKSGFFKWLFALMRPVGQMAFTNYLMQSLLCAIFFYGFGFGMYAKLQRFEIYYVVAAIWLLQIICSHIWLRYFLFGPFEWLWRSLTYWKRQPFLKTGEKVIANPPL